jgi:hypothetical protein
VQLPHEHIYLAVVLDLYSRKCIGWDLSRCLKSDLAMNALAKTLVSRTTESLGDLIHHSDRGVQYASKDYVDCLKYHCLTICPLSGVQSNNASRNILTTGMEQPVAPIEPKPLHHASFGDEVGSCALQDAVVHYKYKSI